MKSPKKRLAVSEKRKLVQSVINYSKYLADALAILLFILFSIVGSIISVVRFWQYDVFYYDFGIFDQAIWRVSRFEAPIIEHLVVGGKWIFADHFNPSLFLLSPLYWISNRSEIMLIAQAIVVAGSGLVIYFIGKEVLKKKFLPLTITLCYFLFIGLQNAVITDFHEVTIMTLPLTLVYLAFVKQKKILYFIFLLITLGFKESTFLLGVGIGISIILLNNKWLKMGIFTIITSIMWGLLAIKIIIPYFSGGIYQYSSDIHFGIKEIIIAFFDNPIKIKTLVFSFMSFGFLPLLSPAFWFLLFQDFLVRFLPIYSYTRWGFGLHYSAQLSPILAISSFYALLFLLRFKRIEKINFLIGLILIINAMILSRFILHAPFGLSYNSAFYNATKNFIFLNNLVDKVPPDKTVMTHNNLAVRFTHNPNVWLPRLDYESLAPEYILFDMRGGQNPNNFFGTVKGPERILRKVKNDKNYTILYKTSEQFVFKRIKP